MSRKIFKRKIVTVFKKFHSPNKSIERFKECFRITEIFVAGWKFLTLLLLLWNMMININNFDISITKKNTPTVTFSSRNVKRFSKNGKRMWKFIIPVFFFLSRLPILFKNCWILNPLDFYIYFSDVYPKAKFKRL